MNQNDAVAWTNAQIGGSIDFDGAYGAQCMDLILAYCAKFGWRPTGDAMTLKDQYIPDGFQRIQNTPDFIPQPGDIFIFTLAPYGHTGIITSANMNSFTSVDQNWFNASDNGSPAAVVTHNYNSFWGVIRPPFTQLVTRDEINAAYQEVFGRDADEGGMQTYLNTGWDINRIKQELYASDEYKTLQQQKASDQAAANAAAAVAEQKAIADKAEANRLAALQTEQTPVVPVDVPPAPVTDTPVATVPVVDTPLVPTQVVVANQPKASSGLTIEKVKTSISLITQIVSIFDKISGGTITALKKSVDKTTTTGKTIRTWLQAAAGLMLFLATVLTLPGFASLMASNGWLELGTITTYVAACTFIFNTIENFLAWLNS